MSTSFNFPANPVLNQIVVLPDGNQAQWNGLAWVSVANNVTYPLSIPNGGTGATNPTTALTNLGGTTVGTGVFTAATALAARTVLGINTATGEFIIPDGTVAKPGLAWANEVGFGFYRTGASNMALAAQGMPALGFDFSIANAVQVTAKPRAAGTAGFAATSNQDPNYVGFVLRAETTQVAFNAIKSGTGGDAPLVMTFPGNIKANVGGTFTFSALSATNMALQLIKPGASNACDLYGSMGATNRWLMRLGDGGPTDDFMVHRCNDAGAVQFPAAFGIARNTGIATHTAVPGQAADLIVVDTGANGAGIKLTGSAGSKTLRVGTDNHFSVMNNAYSAASFDVTDDGIAKASHFIASGNVMGETNLGVGVGMARWRTTFESNIVRTYYNNDVNHRFEYEVATGDFVLAVSAGAYRFNNNGTATAPVQWTPASDGRVKDNRRVIDAAMDKLRQITGYLYHRTDLDIEGAGVIAQDVEEVLPIAVFQQANKDIEDFRYLNYDALTALIVNAVKEVDARLRALEVP